MSAQPVTSSAPTVDKPMDGAMQSAGSTARVRLGDEFTPGDQQTANTQAGCQPHESLKLDHYERTSPVTAFRPNGYGITT
jgi:hypothetical protein